MDADELVLKIRAGEHELVPVLVSMLAPGLLGYAATTSPDLGDADLEQVCETALETAARRLARFDPSIGPFEAWVLPFVRHAASDLRRARHGTTQQPFDDSAATETPVSQAEPTDAELARSASLALLVGRLSEADQVMLGLRFGTPPKQWSEIASELGVPEDALRKRHSRALARLRAIAGDDPSGLR